MKKDEPKKSEATEALQEREEIEKRKGEEIDSRKEEDEDEEEDAEISRKGQKKRKLIVDEEDDVDNDAREKMIDTGNDSELQESPFSPPEAEITSEREEEESVEMDEDMAESKDDFSDNEKDVKVAPLKKDKKKPVNSKSKVIQKSNYHPIENAGWKFGAPYVVHRMMLLKHSDI